MRGVGARDGRWDGNPGTRVAQGGGGVIHTQHHLLRLRPDAGERQRLLWLFPTTVSWPALANIRQPLSEWRDFVFALPHR